MILLSQNILLYLRFSKRNFVHNRIFYYCDQLRVLHLQSINHCENNIKIMLTPNNECRLQTSLIIFCVCRNILSLVEGLLIKNGEICRNATRELINRNQNDPLLEEFPIWVHFGTSVR